MFNENKLNHCNENTTTERSIKYLLILANGLFCKDSKLNLIYFVWSQAIYFQKLLSKRQLGAIQIALYKVHISCVEYESIVYFVRPVTRVDAGD